MYFLSASFSNATSLYVSVNSTNQYVATASNDGNIKIRSMSQFKDLIPKVEGPLPDRPQGEIVDLDSRHKPTKPIRQVSSAPPIDKAKLEYAQNAVNIVGVRSRSKITCLRYANLKQNANLLAAVYKNGEAYIVRDPQNSAKCSVNQIFKHVNGLLLDFSWSADDQLLAFSTMNNEVIVYDVVYDRIIQVLRLHTIPGTVKDKKGQVQDVPVPVKGISFDQTCGKYLLTLGDDKMVNILEYHLVDDNEEGRRFEYKIEQRFSHLISSSKLNKATIKKVSWSSDDRVISVPNTCKAKNTIVSLLKNASPNQFTNWKDFLVFTGYGWKCTMTQFSPVTYTSVADARSPFSYVMATASVDSSFSVWRSSEPQPLFVVHNLCPQPIQDICWSRDGGMVFVTTAGGDLLIGVFQDGELGKATELSERGLVDIEAIITSKMPEIAQRRDQWVLSNKDKKLPLKLVPKTDGQHQTTSRSPSVEQSSLSPRKRSSAATSNNDDGPNGNAGDASGNPFSSSGAGANGSGAMNGSSSNSGSGANGRSGGSARKKPKRMGPPEDYDGPSTTVPASLSHSLNKYNKDKDPPSVNGEVKKRRDLDTADFAGSVVMNPQTSFGNMRIAVPKVRLHLKYASPDSADTVLEVRNGNGHESYPTRVSLIRKLDAGSSAAVNGLAGANNAGGSAAAGVLGASGNAAASNLVTKKELFVDFIPHKVHILTGSDSFWALSTVEGQVITYTNSGRRVLPPLILGSPLSFLEMKDHYLLAVTSIGELYAWDLRNRKALFKPSSLYPLLQPLYRNATGSATDGASGSNGNVSADKNGIVFVNGELLLRSENLTMCSISAAGLPIVTLSNGNGYLYNGDMGTWSLVSDSWWAFGSQYWDSTRTLASATATTEDSSLLNFLETYTNEEIVRRGKAKLFSRISKTMLMREGYENLETVISLNHLENKINLYLFLNDCKNFKTYLTIYVKRLSELNLKDRLKEIFQELFIDMDGSLCGVSKKQLLKELILSCSKQREVQRILVQYGESIGLLEDSLI